ncbi:hypothetical protein Harman_36930 [Haloarcula mannanilytica]|uniref:Uncharacterized protein n=1 Tax=Haloarcula mannanilytica TaxID=2509225 RepID=A0A4C2EME3_9EURY|nr:hypothetical protein Harman_36930 [Haloarcula mannanilytica]
MDEIRPGDIVHIGMVCFVDRAGDMARDRFDMDPLCEPQTERRRDWLAVAMDGTRAPLGGRRILEAGTPYLV